MKNLISLPLCALCALFTGLSTIGQEEIRMPFLNVNPNYPLVNNELDSVIRYSYITPNDSLKLYKWEYARNDSGNYYESLKHSWVKNERKWLLRGKYNYSYDEKKRPTLTEHYDWILNRIWQGCDSEGCGKREWAYDSLGNQILWTQAYWDPHERDWWIDDHWENHKKYDKHGNLIVDIIRTFSGFNWQENGWGGYKDEYSYDDSDNNLGHVFYRWGGWFDSDDWFPETKEEKQYDMLDRMTMKAYYWWLGSWVGGGFGWVTTLFKKAKWTYNSQGLMDTVKFYNWNPGIKNWYLAFETSNKYDDEGRPIYLLDFLEEEGGFYPEIHEYKYNIQGDVTEVIKTQWIEDYNFQKDRWDWSWDLKTKIDYSYTNDRKIKSQINFLWDKQTSSWINSNKTEYNYDVEGIQFEKIMFYWNPENKDWQPDKKKLINVNQLGLMILNANYRWSAEEGDWIGSYKEEKIYDDYGKILMESYYKWNTENDNWMGNNIIREKEGYAGKTEYSYNEYGLLTQYTLYEWSDITNNWIGNKVLGRIKWEYNSNGKPFKEIHFKWDKGLNTWQYDLQKVIDFDNQDNPRVRHQYSWNTDKEEWDIVIREYFYYQTTTSIPTDKWNVIEIFPNPTSDIINITGLTQPAEVKIYSIQGQLMKSMTQVEDRIDVTDLKPGLYILNLTTVKKTIVRKIVVER